MSASTQSAKNQERSRRAPASSEETLECAAGGFLARGTTGLVCGSVGAKGGGERGVAGQVAQHPQNIGGLGAVIDGRNGGGERLAGALAGTLGLGQCQGCARGLERSQSLIAAMLFFNPESAHEARHALVEPCRRRLSRLREPGVGERVDQNAVELVQTGRADGRSQQSAGLEGRVLRAGQVEQRELRAGPLSEPALQEGRDLGLRGGPGLRGSVVFGEGPDGEICAGMGGADGDEEAGSLEAKNRAVEAGRGHAGHLLGFIRSGGSFGKGKLRRDGR